MRRRTVRLVAKHTSRVSVTASTVPLHCNVCGCEVGTLSMSQAETMARLLDRAPADLHLISDGGTTRVCRNSIVHGGPR